MTIQIVTDSACDLPTELIEAYRIKVIPLYINIGNQSYLDGIEMSHEQFYSRLDQFPHHPQTAAPGPETFARFYEECAVDANDHIFAIHVAGSLSAALKSAQKGAEMASVPVTVHDSGQLGLGAGLQVMAAAKAAGQGASIAEIQQIVEDLGQRTHIFAALDTLKFLQRSGRMSMTMLGIGSLLHIKPLLKMHAGEPTSEKVPTRSRAIQRVVQLAANLGALDHLSVVHTYALDAAKKLYQKAADLIPAGNQPYFQSITPVVGAHIGPNVVGLVCVRKEGSSSSR